MRTADNADRSHPVREQDSDRSTDRPERPPSEELIIRSYDHQQAYDVSVEILTDEADLVFQEQYYLLPNQVESESNIVPSGEYTIRVTLDNAHQRVRECSLDETLEHTLVIEVGNGILSLTDGLYTTR